MTSLKAAFASVVAIVNSQARSKKDGEKSALRSVGIIRLLHGPRR
jgi:hypothetical protein